MSASNDQLRSEVVSFFASRFGIDREFLSRLAYRERSNEVWAVSAEPPPGIVSRRPPGLRILRRTPDGLKPTSAFLIHLGKRITSSRVDLDRGTLESLLLGRRLETEDENGYVALSFAGDVVGCGRVHRGHLQAVIPTGRRRELLLALDDLS